MTRKLVLWMPLAVLILAVLACGPGGIIPTTEPVTPGQPIITPTTASATEPPPTQDASACPEQAPGTVLLMNESAGYCALVPDKFQIHEATFGGVLDRNIIGPPLDDSMEPALAFMIINVVAQPGAAAGYSAAQFADEQTALYQGQGMTITREETSIAGQPAVMISPIPGQRDGREAYLVVNDTLYSLYIAPINNQLPVAQPDADLVWSTVTGSITFFPPAPVEFVLPEEVCGTAAEGSTLYVSRQSGYCFQVPATFQADPTWPGVFFGGPELPTLPDYVLPARHTSIAVGLNGPAIGKTVEEMMSPFLENTNPETTIRQDTIIGGVPAIVVEDTSDPIGQRTAYIVANDVLYTALVKPSNATAYPDAASAVEELWTSVTGTMQFFDPWN